ncbi:MAG: MFS transporter [Chloroflexaceae bacterium]|nr:MFS transporter [Chloroflexaceae bacterium]
MMRYAAVFGWFTAAYFLSYFFRSANAIIAPDLSRELSLNAADLGLMTSVFFGAFALAQIPLGLGLDRWGPRWITSGLLFVGAVGSVIFAFAPSFELLMIGRALLGLGMAGALMGAMKIFSKWFHVNQFATLSGLTVGIGSSGALVAASPLAWFNEAFGWRWVFVGGAVITVFIGAAIIIWTRNTPPGVPWTGSTDTGGGVQEVVRDRRFWHIVPLDFFYRRHNVCFSKPVGGAIPVRCDATGCRSGGQYADCAEPRRNLRRTDLWLACRPGGHDAGNDCKRYIVY